jgi:2-polyprenyl-6-methoxyphenol hydroxylase-like FAD-dependent oxidoreductase
MESVVAHSYINKYGDPYAFLVGDAAHAFPPSGGFGMNTGIGDSYNLAHKIAKVVHSPHLTEKEVKNILR